MLLWVPRDIVSHLLVCVKLFGQKKPSFKGLYLWLTILAQAWQKFFDETGDDGKPNNHPGISNDQVLIAK